MFVLGFIVVTLFAAVGANESVDLVQTIARPTNTTRHGNSSEHPASLMANSHSTVRTKTDNLLPWTTDGVVNIPGTDMPLLPNTKFLYPGYANRWTDRYTQTSTGLEAYIECVRHQYENGFRYMTIAIDGGWHTPSISQCYGFHDYAECEGGCTNPMFNYAFYEIKPGSMSGGGNECTCKGGSGATGDACPTDGAEVCQNCDPGHFLSGTACVACPANTYTSSSNSAASCTVKSTCPPGQGVIDAGDTTADLTCAVCVTGTFNDVDDRTPCRVHSTCPAGQGMVTPGSNSVNVHCEECMENTYSFSDSNDVCHTIVEGIRRISSSEVECASGYHGDVAYTSDGSYAGGCEKNVCTCNNGVGATGISCPTHGSAACDSCNGDYVLRNSQCTQIQFPCGDTCVEIQAGNTFPKRGCYYQKNNAAQVFVVNQNTIASDDGFFCAK